jgi:hypothetical protein
MMVLIALSTIAVKQTKATGKTMDRCIQLLDYLATNEMAKIRFHASEMILNIHSDVFCLLETKACSRACGHCFHGLDAKRQQTNKVEWCVPHKLWWHLLLKTNYARYSTIAKQDFFF